MCFYFACMLFILKKLSVANSVEIIIWTLSCINKIKHKKLGNANIICLQTPPSVIALLLCLEEHVQHFSSARGLKLSKFYWDGDPKSEGSYIENDCFRGLTIDSLIQMGSERNWIYLIWLDGQINTGEDGPDPESNRTLKMTTSTWHQCISWSNEKWGIQAMFAQATIFWTRYSFQKLFIEHVMVLEMEDK